jgi:hypothetical protein
VNNKQKIYSTKQTKFFFLRKTNKLKLFSNFNLEKKISTCSSKFTIVDLQRFIMHKLLTRIIKREQNALVRLMIMKYFKEFKNRLDILKNIWINMKKK